MNIIGDKPNSEYIAEFLNYISDVYSEFNWALGQVDIENKRQQDLLHEVEFTSRAKDRNKICTKLHQCRIDRRMYKDTNCRFL